MLVALCRGTLEQVLDRPSIPLPPPCAPMMLCVLLCPCLGCTRSVPGAAAFSNNSLETSPRCLCWFIPPQQSSLCAWPQLSRECCHSPSVPVGSRQTSGRCGSTATCHQPTWVRWQSWEERRDMRSAPGTSRHLSEPRNGAWLLAPQLPGRVAGMRSLQVLSPHPVHSFVVL